MNLKEALPNIFMVLRKKCCTLANAKTKSRMTYISISISQKGGGPSAHSRTDTLLRLNPSQ